MQDVYIEWLHLMTDGDGYSDGETWTRRLQDMSDEDLIMARTYIGRELSARTLAEKPDADKTLL